tara:strand:- start:488 stop:1381 length:894 start_codon:yes stop_codon:yes gene_type:complete
MKVLITGANGFVGSNLVRRLVKDGIDTDVIIRPQSNITSLTDVKKEITEYIHDGTSECMMNIFQESKPDIVCHLAAISNYNHTLDDIEPMIKSNILFGTQLVECMVENKVYNLVNTGTFWQHYKGEEYNPSCLYAATKKAFEDLLKYYVETTKLNTITLKLFDNFGPNDLRGKLFNFLEQSIINNQKIKMSKGEQLIDIIYISDVVNAYIVSIKRLLSNNQQCEEFFVSSNNLITLRKLVSKYLEIRNMKAEIMWGEREYRKREIMKPWNEGKILPGWKPQISIDEGIKLMYNENKK